MHFTAPQKVFGFWKRQIQFSTSPSQRGFDLYFGIVAPLALVFFDVFFVPAVYRSRGVMGGFFGDVRFFGYFEITAATIAIGYYLLTRQASPFLSGVLFSGALFGFVLGIVMLPISIFALVVIIGVVGFTPFLTSFVFLRNAGRCWREASTQVSRKEGILRATLGIVLILGVPAGLQASASCLNDRAMAAVQSGSDRDFFQAVETLKLTRFVVSPDRIAFAYQDTTDTKQRQRLARAFKTVCGRNVEERLTELND